MLSAAAGNFHSARLLPSAMSLPPDKSSRRRSAVDRALAREIVVVLACKAAALAALYALFFSPWHRPSNDAASIGAALFRAAGSERVNAPQEPAPWK